MESTAIAIEIKSFIPKSLSAIDIMKLGKLIQNKERISAKVLFEKFIMENNEWSLSKEVIFETEDKAFAEGGFRMAYKAKSDDESFRGNRWVVKKYNASSKFPILCRFLYDPAIFWIYKGTQNTNSQNKLVYCQMSNPE